MCTSHDVHNGLHPHHVEGATNILLYVDPSPYEGDVILCVHHCVIIAFSLMKKNPQMTFFVRKTALQPRPLVEALSRGKIILFKKKDNYNGNPKYFIILLYTQFFHLLHLQCQTF